MSAAPSTLRLTAGEAAIRYIAAQYVAMPDGSEKPLFAGVWAIFGHGNVAGLGPALHAHRDVLPTLRGHNEQGMALAAVAYAKAQARRRMMAVTTSVGPGATNLVTAAAVAHVNRLPLLLLPGDVFADRRPDPVLQQVEWPGDPTISANDVLKPVSRYFDRITRPEQLLSSLPAALRVLTDPAECGPATLALPQDVQAESADWPAAFFARRLHRVRRPAPDADEVAAAAALIAAAKRPLVICGGGVKYAHAEKALAAFAERRRLPVAETQAGKGALAFDHPANMGSIGVTGTAAANALAAEADLVIALGTRLADFTTGSRALFHPQMRLLGVNVAAFDAAKHGSQPLVGDGLRAVEALDHALGNWSAPASWWDKARQGALAWAREVDRITAPANRPRPSDAEVLGAVNRAVGPKAVLVCAAGGLPGELHKLWRAADSQAYHLEYGYSCMGYEIAGGLGAKLALPEREVVVMVGDGSYLMMNSEIATSVALGAKLTIVVLDNRGFGCINRLQQGTGGAPFNNLLAEAAPAIDFAAHAASLGAQAEKVASLAALPEALARARAAARTAVVVIDTDPAISTGEGGAWWDVPVAVAAKRPAYETARKKQKLGA